MSTATKRPYSQVLPLAERLIQRLSPSCERIELAGSLRRQAAMVGDIELVAIPKPITDLFGDPGEETLVDSLLRNLPVVVTKNGPKYKQFTFSSTTGNLFVVDLFLQPDPATWGVNMMIRTGSASFSKAMVTPLSIGGLMPDRYRVRDARVWEGDDALETPEEGDVFELWGLDYIEPQDRDQVPAVAR